MASEPPRRRVLLVPGLLVLVQGAGLVLALLGEGLDPLFAAMVAVPLGVIAWKIYRR